MNTENSVSLHFYKKNLSNNLKYLLDQHSLSILDLSTKLGLAYASLYNSVHGQSNPTLESLSKIADYFNLSIGQIIGDNNIALPLHIKTIPIIKWIDILDFINKKITGGNYPDSLIISSNRHLYSNSFAVLSDKKAKPIFDIGTILIFYPINSDITDYDNKLVLTVTNDSLLNIKKLFVEGEKVFLQNPDLNINPQQLTSNVRIIASLFETRILYD